MEKFLPTINLDLISIGIGFLAGILFWILYRQVNPRIAGTLRKISRRIKSINVSKIAFEKKDHHHSYRQQAYQVLQSKHIFSDYFPLEDILVTPTLMPPPPLITPGGENTEPSLLHQTLSYDPCSPVFPMEYEAPGLTLVEALSSGLDICVLGKAGFGKTITLIDAAIKLLKRETQFPSLVQKVPFYLQAQYILAQFPNSNLQDILQKALAADSSFVPQLDFSNILFSSLQTGTCLLFVDDLGSLPEKDMERVVNFLRVLKIQYPSLQIVVTVGPEYIGNLHQTSFVPLYLSGWNKQTKLEYLEKWSFAWDFIQSDLHGSSVSDNIAGIGLWKNWLASDTPYVTPLEFVLKVFGFYNNQISGSFPMDAIESYLLHITSGLPLKIIDGLEIAAVYSLDQSKAYFSRQSILSWIRTNKQKGSFFEQEGKESPFSRAIQVGLEQGLIHEIKPGFFSFRFQTIAGLLASRGLSNSDPGRISELFLQTDWLLKNEAFRYFPAHNEVKTLLPMVLNDSDPLKKKLAQAGLWLPYLSDNSAEKEALLRAITREINNTPFFIVKSRLVSMLAISGSSEVSAIFTHLLQSTQVNVRRAAALGSGFLHDQSAISLLAQQLSDPSPSHFAACFALGKIGTPQSLEAVAHALLSGDELLRRAAANALSQHPSEGHPALREGSLRDDILVRYAVVHGLRNIKKPWAVEILDTMRTEDEQWVVRDAAQQAFEDIAAPSAYIPRKAPAIENMPWLIDFAEKHGSELSSPDAAQNVILLALQEGTDEIKQAALGLIRELGYKEVFPAIYLSFSGSNPETINNAEFTLWQISSSTMTLPDPDRSFFQSAPAP